MAATGSWQPKGGERCLVTIEAVYHDETIDGPAYAVTDGPLTFHFGASRVRKVEPIPRPLPTEPGAMILGPIRDLVNGGSDLALLQLNDRSTWEITAASEEVEVEDILPGWVRFDPVTLRTVEDPE